MQRNKLSVIRDFIVKHCKIVFPIIVIVVVAFTVSVALHVNRERNTEDSSDIEGSTDPEDGNDVLNLDEIPEIPLLPNENSAIYTLIATYYNALGIGDMETLASTYDTISDIELLWKQALSPYLDHYAELQVNTKQGPVADSVIAYIYYRVCFVNHEEEFPGYEMLYICTNEDGSLYIKNESNFTEEDVAYITAVSSQDDVIEFNNRVNVEYKDLMREKPYLLKYMEEVINQRDIDYGILLASLNKTDSPEDGNEGEGENQEGEGTTDTPGPGTETVPAYATATTSGLNVRSSDSTQASSLGKIGKGTRLQVLEVRVNGWTKVLYNGSEGYIKTEYLEFEESAAGQNVIGTVTAVENVRIRADSSTSSEHLGTLIKGEKLDLLAVEGEWCKVVFNGRTAYVMGKYVTVQQ